MEGRKTKHEIARMTIHYLFCIIMIILTIISFIYRKEIKNYFNKDLTKFDTLNTILHYTSNLINSIQVIVLACLIIFILKIWSKLGIGLTDKGKTIINLVNNLLKWIVIIIAILFILAIFNVNTKTLLTGASLLALIIGLGAQSLIADILAGIFIVLEGKYVVGDIVVIDGWRGKIISIGIRTTELQDIGGNIKIINNSEIKSVINQTKLQSVANCSINVSSSVSLLNVEQIIISSLDEIKKSIPTITNDIIYKGINNVTDVSMELIFSASCYEEDLYQTKRDLYRQLKLLLDKNHIDCFAPPTYVINQVDKK